MSGVNFFGNDANWDLFRMVFGSISKEPLPRRVRLSQLSEPESTLGK